MSSNLEDIAAFASVLTRYAPKNMGAARIGFLAIEISRDADALRKLAEKDCNGEMTERDEARQTRVEAKVKSALAEFGATEIRFNGDPRGSAVKVKFKGGETYGDWGGEGLWCL